MNKVQVIIAGKQYTIMGEESEEYIQKVGLFVNKKIKQIENISNSNFNTTMVYTLSAVDIADELFKEKEKTFMLEGKTLALERQLKEFNQKIKKLESTIKQQKEVNSKLDVDDFNEE